MIAAPSQATFGRAISMRGLSLRPGTSAEKTFVALWVLAFSGIIGVLVNIKANPEFDPYLDSRFLLLIFFGGFPESLVVRSIPGRMRHHLPAWSKKRLGFAWAYFFFYCTVIVPVPMARVLSRSCTTGARSLIWLSTLVPRQQMHPRR